MVVVERTAWGALQRIKGVSPGPGMDAYRILCQRCARHATMSLQELRMQVMKPGQAMNAGEVTQKFEEWAEAEVELTRVARVGCLCQTSGRLPQ